MTQKGLTILFLCVVVSFAAMIETNQETVNNLNTPKIPMYVGSSYHILYGNPKSGYGLDPGFYHPVFEFTYAKNKTTEDQKYLIPDETTSHKMSTCSFTTEVSSFRGTQSYQQDLKQTAQVSIGSTLLAFAFSMSQSYQRVYNSTSVQKMSVTHANAECQAYEIILDKFALPEFNEDFIQGAIYSYKRGNWTEFIQEFGTHYIHEIVMGGRAIQQTSYTYQSVSKMQSLEIDINMAAKASYAMFFGDTSFDWKNYQRQINYSQKIETSKTEFYIGGQPPRTGNIYDWQAKIVDNPMPISYKLFPLSQLFERISDVKFDSTLAATQFEDALSKECDRLNCLPITPDFPKPSAANITTLKTQLYGDAGGHDFDQFVNSTTMQLRRVHVRSAGEVDNLQLFISDGITQHFTSAVGGLGGDYYEWSVPDGEYINQIEYRCDYRIDSLTFITNKGNKSPKFGGTGGTYQLVNIPQDYRIVGFYGTQGTTVYRLGFTVARTIYPKQVNGEEEVEYQRIELQ